MQCFALGKSGRKIVQLGRSLRAIRGALNGRTIARFTTNKQIFRRTARLLEGNRGIPPSRRYDRPALGKARGDARPSASARQGWLGVCLQFRVGPLAEKPQTALGA